MNVLQKFGDRITHIEVLEVIATADDSEGLEPLKAIMDNDIKERFKCDVRANKEGFEVIKDEDRMFFFKDLSDDSIYYYFITYTDFRKR